MTTNRAHVGIWFRRLEIDQTVVFGILTKVCQLLAGPVTLVLIARCMSAELQGFYYTFASLLALQSFVELSLSVVILNFASHEWSRLKLDETGLIVGNPESLSRLVSLGGFAMKWYAVASALFVLGVGLGGQFFFSRLPHPDIAWKGPWWMLVLSTGLILWALPFNALLEGCNQVANVQKFRLSQAVLSTLALWLSLLMGWGLWAAVASATVMVLRDGYLLGIQYGKFFRPFLRNLPGPRVRWKQEIAPMQWRLAISNVGNYFVFGLFNPVMFHYHGPVVAGQMGMTWTLVVAVQSVAVMWVYAKVPRFGMLAAQRDYQALDRIWLRTSLISLAVATAGAAALWSLVYGLNVLQVPLATRLLPLGPTGLLLFAIIFMQITHCEIVYLRAHKQEPIMLMGITTNLIVGLFIWGLGRNYGPTGAAAALLMVWGCLNVPWTTAIWFTRRTAWHHSTRAHRHR